MSDGIKAFWLGVFIIVGIALTTWLVMFLKPSAGDKELTLKVRFSNIDKIERGTRVTFAGKPVGEVSEILEVKDPRCSPSDEFGNLYIYELILEVDSSVHIYSYDEIVFASSGLLGEKSVAIIPKATPPGSPPSEEVTHDILYARSTDKLEETLNRFSQVAVTFGETMEGVNNFMVTNSCEFNKTLKSISSFMEDAKESAFIQKASNAANALATTFTEIDNQQLIKRMGMSLDKISEATDQITKGEGTLGRLIQSDAFYTQVSGTMNRLDTLLYDINQYGLLFQYDKGWQRRRGARRNQIKQLSTPCDIYQYLDSEVKDLLGRVEYLQNSLMRYTEMLQNQYCQP